MGTVVDPEGRPIAGARVRVNTGWGTLLGGSEGVTDAAGRYEVKFAPGMRFSEEGGQPAADPVRVQAAAVHVSKPGYYETNLCQAGDLVMASELAYATARQEYPSASGVVREGVPYTLNFELARAAHILGQVIDPAGAPLAGLTLSLTGEQLPPATNVLASIETDSEGRFEVSEVPLKETYFYVGTPREMIKTTPYRFTAPGTYVALLVYDAEAKNLTAHTSRVEQH